MVCRVVDRGRALSFKLAGVALFVGASALSCGTGAPSQPEIVEVTHSTSEQLSIVDPAAPLALALPQGSDPLMTGLVVPADAPQKGMWSATQPWPLNGLHSVLLPNGKVLTFGTPTGNAATQDGRYFDVWDPAQGFGSASHQTSFQAERVNSFCSAAAYRLDGRLLVSGGNSPLDSNVFSPSTSGVTTSSFRLADERWYGSLITLSDGKLLMLGGSTPYGGLRAYQDPNTYAANGVISMTPELYDATTGWRSLFGAQSREAFGPDHHRYWYPRAWVAPNGQVFGISSEKMWYLDPAGNGSVAVAGDFKTGVNATTRPNIGPTSAAVMFAPGRILQVGGNGYHDGHATPSSALATVVDITGASPVVAETAPMGLARQWPSATVLPDGRVVVTGGTRFGNNGGADAVYAAELWNPATGTWTVGASAAQIRVYHSAAILMPNGVVLSTGGGAPGPVNNLNAELYYPPYLFRPVAGGGAELAPRVQLSAISSLEVAYGAQLDVDLAAPTTISKVVLIGTSSVTHSFNGSQRRQELPFLQQDGRLAIGVPTSENDAPPGYYLLIVIDSSGVPSKGVIVSVGTVAPEPPGNTLLPSGSVVSLLPINLPDHSAATTTAGLGVVSVTGTTEAERTQFIVREGLADPNCVSLEAVAQPGQVLRHQAYRLKLGADDGTALFKGDATFCPEAGLDGTGVTLRSKNFPERVIRHVNYELWIDPVLDDPDFAADATFEREFVAPAIDSVIAPVATGGGARTYTAASPFPGRLEYQWNFGDGTGNSGYSTSPTISHTFAAPGVYSATLSARSPDGAVVTTQFLQAVAPPAIAGTPLSSSNLAIEPRAGQSPRLWVVNIDNDTVSAFDTATGGKLAEVSVGSMPRSVAVAPSGSIWVANKGAATLSVIDPNSLVVTRTVALPRASQPFGIVVAANGNVFVALEGLGRVLKLDSAGATLATLDVGPNPRHLALNQGATQLLVSRFITPPQPGEGTAAVQTSVGGVPVGGEVLLVDPATLALVRTIRLRHSDRPDTAVSARGVPNYLGAPAISRDGKSAFVPSKQDNIQRGRLRDQNDLDFETTVRAISSRIDLVSQAEEYSGRIDHDNSSVASAAVYDLSGAYLFVALETSREVAVVDASGKRELFRVDAGRAPQGLVVSADGTKLYVHNALDRTAGVYDLTPLLQRGQTRLPLATTLASVAVEKLTPQVLNGKQLFYDARDPRLARDAYLSCASCHNDGGSDGRTWDLTGLGEGLRNTVYLRGRAGGEGRLHWSGNFDEVQDFEGQIRSLSQGTGLMTDAAYNNGTRSQPLGSPKAGVSADLDALAAYVGSLFSFAPSPYRSSSGALTAAASAGRSVFAAQCVACHGGNAFNDSATLRAHDLGTLKPASGSRLGAPLLGLDTPSLRDVWLTAPYLHDGSAASIGLAIQAHKNVLLTPLELSNVSAFVQQIGGEEAAVPAAVGAGLVGQYFANTTLSGVPVITRTEAVNFDWGTGTPGAGVAADSFSVRWIGQLSVPTSGSYVFQTVSDDGVRLYLNGSQLINNWTDHATTANNSSAVALVAGRRYDIVLEYYERAAGAVAKLNWQLPGTTGFAAIPAAQLYATSTQGLLGQYFANTTLSGVPALTRTEAVNFDWGTGSPGGGLAANAFSVRWTGQVSAPASGSYVFQTLSDDGVRLWLNGSQLINNWTDHATATNNSSAVMLVAGQRYDIVVEYYERSNGAVAKLNWQTPGATAFVAVPLTQLHASAHGLLGQYFNNTTLAGAAVMTRNEAVNFDWAGAPAAGLPADAFSVRWTGRVAVAAGGSYTFHTTSDDGVRLWVDGALVVDNWTTHAPMTNNSPAVVLKAGLYYDLKLEYFEGQAGAVAKLAWTAPGTASAVPIPQTQLYGY